MIIGRKEETELLKRIAKDDKSHFVAIYGRRRVGKTFLVRESYNYKFTFQHAGYTFMLLFLRIRKFISK